MSIKINIFCGDVFNEKILALVIMTIITFSQLSAFAMVESAECACVINALTGDVVFSKKYEPKTRNGKHN